MSKKYTLPVLKLTIFQKLLIGIIAMLVLNSIIAFVGIVSISELDSSGRIMLEESKGYNNLQDLKSNFHQLQMPSNDYLIHGNKIELTNFAQLDSLAKEQIKICKVYTGKHFGKKFMNGLEKSLYDVEIFSKEIFKLENPVGNPAGAIMMEKMDSITNKVSKNIDSLLVISIQEMDHHINTNQATNIRASRIIIFVGLFIVICLVVGGFFYVKNITKPLENLALLT